MFPGTRGTGEDVWIVDVLSAGRSVCVDASSDSRERGTGGVRSVFSRSSTARDEALKIGAQSVAATVAIQSFCFIFSFDLLQ